MVKIIRCPVCKAGFVENNNDKFYCPKCNSQLVLDSNNRIHIFKIDSKTRTFIIFRIVSILIVAAIVWLLISSYDNYTEGLLITGIILICNPILFLFGELRNFSEFLTIELYYQLFRINFSYKELPLRQKFWLLFSHILIAIGILMVITSIIVKAT